MLLAAGQDHTVWSCTGLVLHRGRPGPGEGVVMPARSAAPRPPGALELAVHTVVAAAGARGLTVAGVAAAVVPAVSYSTAVTTLRRLESRGVLGRRRVGRTIQYTTAADSAAVTATATAHRLHRQLAAAPDRCPDPRRVRRRTATRRRLTPARRPQNTPGL